MRRSISLLALVSSVLTACHSSASLRLDTREKVISGFDHVLKSWDKDGDNRLSRSEVEAMADEWVLTTRQGIRPGEVHPELETERQRIIAYYMSQDADKDGYLTLAELLKEPIATFHCADADQDGTISKSEERSAIDRCSSSDIGATRSSSRP